MFAVERRGHEVLYGVSLTHNVPVSVEMKLPKAEKYINLDAVVEPWPSPARGFICRRGPRTIAKPFPEPSPQLHRVAEVCTGIGGLGRGATAAGNQVVLQNEIREATRNMPLVVQGILLTQSCNAKWQLLGPHWQAASVANPSVSLEIGMELATSVQVLCLPHLLQSQAVLSEVE